jgi:small subunit ribosomal protein S20
MANIKSAKKQARQNEVARVRNLARTTSIKTAIKKVLMALEEGQDASKTQELLKVAQAQLARAKNKRVLHANTASRKISRLAKRVAAANRETQKSA